MHTAVHQLIARRGTELAYRPPRGRLLVFSQATLFQRDEGWEGLGGVGGGASNVCVMSKKGIKTKEGIIRNLPLRYHREKRQIKAAEMKINKLC